ncbi:monothiol glutaredoxin [Penicillium concentricum]|uniref:Monothiol glutaredoxin-5, mitochondrial n=1 Tax=Penicillium concentricum TaxID=293559 RepID=A0A9W9RB19_9EURO|nr:monothiol glutaredoxin [Penicillium concentricum]KAJ5356265.1 monothiol glutaredoxin [Penicillium concentricum]
MLGSSRLICKADTADRSIRFLSEKSRLDIDQAVAAAPIVVFMKGTPEIPQCGFSRAIIQILGREGVDPGNFVAFDVLKEPGLREDIKMYSNWLTIPQMYLNQQFIGGYDTLIEMHRSGNLKMMLQENDGISDRAEIAPHHLLKLLPPV